MKKLFAVMGATGHIGRVLVQELLKAGHEVRAIGRDAQKLEALRAQGAAVVSAAFDDVTRLTKAFSGCDGVFVMIPPDYAADDPGVFQDRIGEGIREALLSSQARKILNLSSVGAQHAEGTGPIKGLHRQESRLNSLPGADVLHLRPCFFMQNFFWSVPAIRERGVIASALKGDLPLWMVSTDDIGRQAAQLLAQGAFEGKSVFEFVGPRPLSQIEATRLLGAALKMADLKYVQLSYADEEKALQGAGMKAGIVRLFVEMHRGANEGLIVPTQTLRPEQKGTITFESFAREFAEAFQAHAVTV